MVIKKVVNKILEICNKTSIEDFIGNKQVPLSITEPLLHFNIVTTLTNQQIFYGPRVGLTLKKSRQDIFKYLMKGYRALIHPTNIKVFKTGIILKLHADGQSVDNISKLVGTTQKNIQKYIQYYDDGKTLKIEDFVGETLNVQKLYNVQALTAGLI